MKRKLHFCCMLLCGLLAISPLTASAESYKTAQTIDPISIETDAFSYYTTSADSMEKMGEGWGQEPTDKLYVTGTEANFLITGIYESPEYPDYLLYTAVHLKTQPPNEIGRGQFYSFAKVPGSETVQVGDLIYIPCGFMESNPPKFGCGGEEATFTNYGNACDVLGDEFMEVLRQEVKVSLFYGLGKQMYNEGFRPLPVSAEIGDMDELFPMAKSGDTKQVYGDFNHDGVVNASDATFILYYAAKQGAGTLNDSAGDVNGSLAPTAKDMEAQIENTIDNSDFNHDGLVNASDAAVLLIYAAEYGAGTFPGTFEEYVNS